MIDDKWADFISTLLLCGGDPLEFFDEVASYCDLRGCCLAAHIAELEDELTDYHSLIDSAFTWINSASGDDYWFEMADSMGVHT